MAALAGIALDLVVLGLAAFGPLGDVLFRPVEGWPWWAQVVGFTALVEALTAAVALPLAFWTEFVRERRWGFSTQRASEWAADRSKAFAVGLVLSAVAFLGLVGAARVFPRAWPVAAGLAGAMLVVALGLLGPVVIEPLFNRFAPLADQELRGELLGLAEEADLRLREVLVADASRRSRKANAYVSGLGPTRRLVLFDTLLERASNAEVGLVLAHELGHHRARHLVKGTALAVAGVAAFAGVLWALLRMPELLDAIDAPGGAADPQVVPFVLLLGAVLMIPGAPLGAALSRRWEREADRFSLELTHDVTTFEATQRSLAEANLSDLDPPRLVYLVFFTHPTPVERIEAARSPAAST
jgi:STE24 endopeptidase